MRTPEESCELIEKISFEVETNEANQETLKLFVIQGGYLMKAAAEETENDVRRILVSQEIQNRLVDHICLLCGCLKQALAEVPEGKLKQRMLKVGSVNP